MGGFGDYYGVTSVHPLGAIAVVLLGVLTLALPRRQALVPFIIAACTIPMAQRFVIAGCDFTLLRLLILFGAARVLSRNEMRGVIWTGMDTLVMLWCVSCTLIMTLQHGTDIVRMAIARGWGAYVIDAPVIHNSLPVRNLLSGYRQSYQYMQRKWRHELPLPTCVVPVTRSGWPLLSWQLRAWKRNWRHRAPHPGRHPNPAMLAKELGYTADTESCDLKSARVNA